jgi:hypothetical protein
LFGLVPLLLCWIYLFFYLLRVLFHILPVPYCLCMMSIRSSLTFIYQCMKQTGSYYFHQLCFWLHPTPFPPSKGWNCSGSQDVQGYAFLIIIFLVSTVRLLPSLSGTLSDLVPYLSVHSFRLHSNTSTIYCCL